MVSDYKYIVTPLIAWLVAHCLKVLILAIKTKRLNLRPGPGSMPSGHSAIVVSVLTIIGLSEGITNPLFGLALAVAMIVVYDAVHVRFAVGEQAKAIGRIVKEAKLKIEAPKIVRGHTYPEMIVGSLIGFLIGCVVFITTC